MKFLVVTPPSIYHVPNYTVNCSEYSKVKYLMMVLGEYICDIPPTGGKAFIPNTTNGIISTKIRPRTLLNGKVLHMDLAHSLITIICISIYKTCSYAAVVLRVDIPDSIILRFSNYLSIYNVSTYFPCL